MLNLFKSKEATTIPRLARGGRVDLGPNYWVVIHPQLLNPTPAIVASLDFRRALLYALDRQQMVDTLQAGMTICCRSRA